MSADLERLVREFRKAGHPDIADGVKSWANIAAQRKDLPKSFSPVETPAETPQTFSKDQLILSETQIPQEVSEVLDRAKDAGITSLEPYHLSGVTLAQDSQVEGWNKRPEPRFWERIANGEIAPAKLPDAWVLVDKTERPGYKDGKQLHENDPFGSLLKRLRREKKVETIKGIPETSRFGLSHDELTKVVLPEIATLLGVDASQVRLPKAIEFNVIGNSKHPEWGNTNTWEWFADGFGVSRRLFGGGSGDGGLTLVPHLWSDNHYVNVAFRPLVVVSPKA